jgi:hypothetical protein
MFTFYLLLFLFNTIKGAHCTNTTDVTSGAGTAYPSGAPGFTLGFQWDSCYSIVSFICMLW